MGLAVIRSTGGDVDWRRAPGREVLGKWTIAVVVAVLVGRALVGNPWVPTA